VPAPPGRLVELAYNLWWSWHPEAQALFQSIDPALWEQVGHNPVRFLGQVRPARLDATANDADYLARSNRVRAAFDAALSPKETWFSRTYPELVGQTIAYFSAEFGLHEALPIYSGGLGILSGDHCKEASDLGLPLVGLGFLYPQGYFKQQIDGEGRQAAIYEKLDFSAVPARPALDPAGRPVVISVELPGRTVFARVWHIQVGRVPLFLMDTDVEPNAPSDRELSARLYGGDQEMRISQEIVLGIGGVRALRALGFRPGVWHMNEGHSAFLGLERVRELVEEQGLSFDQARLAVAAGTIFTTHTPVPAGNDTFPLGLVERYFQGFWQRLGLTRQAFLELGRHDQPWGPTFSMTVLGLHLSSRHNGVSDLHGQVARKMWQFLWPNVPVDQVPIGHVTNGIHTDTWLAPEMAVLYDQYLGAGWRDRLDEPDAWDRLNQVPDQVLWQARCRLRHRMINFVRRRERERRQRLGWPTDQVAEADRLLDPDALTIGFARRFATYKRATLIFSDLERLRRILNDPARPAQLVFAGKAHPADEPGKALIQQVYQVSQLPGFRGRVVLVEDYDMDAARHLVQGVDVWLNTPRRPLEASGTSGQKAALNGVPNFSVLDGWWREGYDGRNGWAIGDEHDYPTPDAGSSRIAGGPGLKSRSDEPASPQAQDVADSLALYRVLEKEIVPSFYTRSQAGIPWAWLQVIREAIRSVAPRFSTRRMVKEYTDRLYLPAARLDRDLSADDYARARRLADWKVRVHRAWSQVQVEGHTFPKAPSFREGPIEVTARVWLGELRPDDVRVELVHVGDGQRPGDGFEPVLLQPAGPAGPGAVVYRGQFVPAGDGATYAVRVVPSHPDLMTETELGLVRWSA
jgi:starch phosphorylase